jgi:hypothetical protein
MLRTRQVVAFRPRFEFLEARTVPAVGSGPSVTADFNGDGFGDLAVGVPQASDKSQ